MRRKSLVSVLLVLLLVLFIGYTLRMLLSVEIAVDRDLGRRKPLAGFNRDLDTKQRQASRETAFDRLARDYRLAQEFLTLYNVSRPYEADFRCVTMKTQPPTPVCLYNEWRDMYISHDLLTTGLWERHIVADFTDALRRDRGLGVIDVGANVGVYALLAANMGRPVVAVEPLAESLYRLHRAAILAKSERSITALQNAISDRRGAATIRRNGDNQGDTRIVPGYEPCIGSCPTKVNTVLLSDLRFVANFDRAILKMDTQGYEHLAFQHAAPLLDTIFVPYIYMEWLVMKEHFKAANHSSDAKDLVNDMVDLLYVRHYRPHSVNAEGATELDKFDWGRWPNDIVWRHLPCKREYKNLIKNHFMIWP